ncbi:hypothetical protein LguiB_022523 [Lonicera macranthoides]
MEAEVPISGTNNTTGKEKKTKRKEILEKKKAIDEIIKSACTGGKDNLAFYPPYQYFHKNGLCLYLESGCGDKLSSQLKLYIQNLLKLNMEGPYGSEWPVEEKVKRREMVSPEARYVFVYEPSNENTNHIPELVDRESTSAHCVFDNGPIVGFVHYRFTIEEEIPVLYVYELQLHPRVQGKGLGAFLMELTGLIARKNRMGAVVLTVQKANSLALNFYTSKMRYTISTISPSRVDPLNELHKSYEILCKTFSREAQAILEESE